MIDKYILLGLQFSIINNRMKDLTEAIDVWIGGI